MVQIDDTLDRLDKQLKWYSDKSKNSQNWFKRIKLSEIIAAALIPFFVGINIPSIVIGGLGVVIIVLQSVQSLFQFQTNWISTDPQLKH